MVESAVGVVPEGWEVVKTAGAIDINPSTEESRTDVAIKEPSVCMMRHGLSTNTMLITEVGLPIQATAARNSRTATRSPGTRPVWRGMGQVTMPFVRQFLPTRSNAVASFGSTEFSSFCDLRTLCAQGVCLSFLARSDAVFGRHNQEHVGSPAERQIGVRGEAGALEATVPVLAHRRTRKLWQLVSPSFSSSFRYFEWCKFWLIRTQLFARRATCCCRGWWRGWWGWEKREQRRYRMTRRSPCR